MDSYETWPNRIVRPGAPDPFRCVPFSKEAWECLDIDFFGVSFYGSLIDVTCLPCINGFWGGGGGSSFNDGATR